MKRFREFGCLVPGHIARLVFLRAATALFIGVMATGSAWGWQEDDDDDERRRNWDPAEMLQRLDRDGNGILDANEMGGRSSRFIERMGFDPSRPIPVDNIRRKIDQDREAEERVARREAVDKSRKVPKFGEPAELPEVPGFGLVPGSPLAASIAPAAEEYSEEVMESVARVLERFDEDKDGFLAGEETRRIGRFLGADGEADVDKDGRLSQTELAGAYQRMVEERERRGEEGWRGRRGGRGDDEDGGDDGERGPRGSFRRGGGENERGEGERRREPGERGDRGGNSSPEQARPSRQPDSGRSSPPARSMDARVTEYVDGLFRKYDSDGDGKLSSEERASLKVPFKDTDEDGSISRDEASAFVSGAQQGGGSVSPAARRDAGGTRRNFDRGERGEQDGAADGAGDVRRDVVWSGRTPVPQPARPGGEEGDGRGAFGKRDRNGDGQLQFAEYLDDDDLTDEIYEAFQEADRNRDGVLTPDEYDGGR